jgi:acetone carboxylase gamma subunit
VSEAGNTTISPTSTSAGVGVQRPRRRIGDAFVLSGEEIRCADCDRLLGPRTQDPKLGAVVAERSLSDLSELNRFGTLDELVLREYYCPGCGAMLAANVQRPTDPVLIEIELAE